MQDLPGGFFPWGACEQASCIEVYPVGLLLCQCVVGAYFECGDTGAEGCAAPGGEEHYLTARGGQCCAGKKKKKDRGL